MLAKARAESLMRGAVMYGPGDVRVEQREEPRIVEPTDAIIHVSAACVCGSDPWPYRGIEQLCGLVPESDAAKHRRMLWRCTGDAQRLLSLPAAWTGPATRSLCPTHGASWARR